MILCKTEDNSGDQSLKLSSRLFEWSLKCHLGRVQTCSKLHQSHSDLSFELKQVNTCIWSYEIHVQKKEIMQIIAGN